MDLAAKHVTNRSTFGNGLPLEKLMLQIAHPVTRAFDASLLPIENGMDCKKRHRQGLFGQHGSSVVDTALQRGALGYSYNPLPLTGTRSQRLVDGG